MEKSRHKVTWTTREREVVVVGQSLLSLEQMLCRERPYVKNIPLTRPNARFLVASPVRKPSFYDVTRPVVEMTAPVVITKKAKPEPRLSRRKKPKKKKPQPKPKVLRSVIYEERIRDIVNRVSRTTYSCKSKRPALVLPRETYTCCPIRII